jgi:RNA 3'-terminal phosphate cyclase
VNAVAEICGAKVSDVIVGSQELEFAPEAIKAVIIALMLERRAA